MVSGGGLVTFHGPMVATGKFFTALPPPDLKRLHAALFAEALTAAAFPPLQGQALYGAVGRGRERGVGVLVGGNLSTLASLCGTGVELASDRPYILVLEDHDETAQRIDRLCQQLRMAGLLDERPGQMEKAGGSGRGHLAGIVLGRFDKSDVLMPSGALGQGRSGGGGGGGGGPLCCAKQVWGEEHTSQREIRRFAQYWENQDREEPQAFFWRRVVELSKETPTIWRCGFGHGTENATLPLGAACAVEPTRGVLELASPEEAAALWA